MSVARFAAYALFTVTAAIVIAWLSYTPLATPLAAAIAPACLARALVPLRWVPWLRHHPAVHKEQL